MRQLDLFKDENVARRELQMALEKVNVAEATRLRIDFTRLWGDSRLDWELDVLHFY
ncbi:MAG: hypothetical protein ACE5MK_01725 [Acidobacteriota bacterium]